MSFTSNYYPNFFNYKYISPIKSKNKFKNFTAKFYLQI